MPIDVERSECCVLLQTQDGRQFQVNVTGPDVAPLGAPVGIQAVNLVAQ